jgi:hypothetical protein
MLLFLKRNMAENHNILENIWTAAILLCEISGSHVGKYEEDNIL